MQREHEQWIQIKQQIDSFFLSCFMPSLNLRGRCLYTNRFAFSKVQKVKEALAVNQSVWLTNKPIETWMRFENWIFALNLRITGPATTRLIMREWDQAHTLYIYNISHFLPYNIVHTKKRKPMKQLTPCIRKESSKSAKRDTYLFIE